PSFELLLRSEGVRACWFGLVSSHLLALGRRYQVHSENSLKRSSGGRKRGVLRCARSLCSFALPQDDRLRKEPMLTPAKRLKIRSTRFARSGFRQRSPAPLLRRVAHAR